MEASNLHQHWVKKHFLVYKNNFPGVNLHQIKVKLIPLSVFYTFLVYGWRQRFTPIFVLGEHSEFTFSLNFKNLRTTACQNFRNKSYSKKPPAYATNQTEAKSSLLLHK